MALDRFTLTGTFWQYGRAPEQGYVQITSAPIQDASTGRTLLGGARYRLDRLGRFTASLPASGTYTVTAHLGHKTLRPKTFPAFAAGQTVDYATIVPSPATLAPAATTYDSLVYADKPVAYWALDGSTAYDYSGNGRHATTIGTVTQATMPGGVDKAAVFNGSSYLEAPDANAFSIPTTGKLTVEAWMRPDTLEFAHSEAEGYVHWLGKGSTDRQEWTARMYSKTNTEVPPRPNRISGYAFNLTGGLGTGSYFQDTVTAGEWIHYALVINTTPNASFPHGYVKVYKNGILRDQDDLFATAAVVPGNGTAPVRIGTRDLASFFQGAIGKVAIYDYEVPQQRLLVHVRKLTPPPAGTAAFVRTIGTATATTAGTTLTIPVATAVPAGHTVIVRAAHDYTSGAPAAVDSKGNVYTRDRTAANTGTTMRASVWSAPVTTALAPGDTITVTTTSVAARVAVASDFAGVVSASPVDQTNGGAGTSTTPAVSGGITTTNGNDLLVALLAVEGPGTDQFVEDNETGLFTQTARVSTATGGADDTNITVNCAYRTVATVGTYTYEPNLGTARNWIEAVVAYKATGA